MGGRRYIGYRISNDCIQDTLSCPRQHIDYLYRGTNKGALSKSVVLKHPCISEKVSDEIRKFIRYRDLPVKVIFKPGVKLQELLCSSRPHHHTTNGNIHWLNLRYALICLMVVIAMWSTLSIGSPDQLCSDIYIVEISRTIHDRLSKHLKFYKNPMLH